MRISCTVSGNSTMKTDMKKRKLFCELGPAAYAISRFRHIVQRSLRDMLSGDKFAKSIQEEDLPVVVSEHSCGVIKRGPGIDPGLQLNKAKNIENACIRINGLIVNSGETFSFWHAVGATTRGNGFHDGRVLVNGKLMAGVGGGLCNLANSLHIIFMHSPMTITELHHHSDALAPDPGGVRVPYSAGTSVNYNYIDLRFRNDTGLPVQITARCYADRLTVQLRAAAQFPYVYDIEEEGHHFHKEPDGNYYRISRIYRNTYDRASHRHLSRELKWDNRSKVMFDPSLIPPGQIN